MPTTSDTIWPKVVPPLTEKQQKARESFMLLWHQQLPTKYGVVERFNHGFPAKLPLKPGGKTLEIGAGIGGHLPYEDLSQQDYHCLEYREEFCKILATKIPSERVHCGDIQVQTPWPEAQFDRVVAIHVLEHLPNLPAALKEIRRVLKPGGVLDIVIPCEGGFAHTMGRKVSAERLFKKHFHMDFTPICKNEHVNTFPEIYSLLKESFEFTNQSYFPLLIPYYSLNFVAGFRLVAKV